MTRAPTLLPSEWRALLWKYAVGAVVVLIALFALGVCYGQRRGVADGERLRQSIAKAGVQVALSYAAEHNERTKTDAALAQLRDSIAANAPAKAAAARATARARAANAVADSIGKTFTIDTVPVVVDTTAFVMVVRSLSDTTPPEQFRVPKFLLDAFIAERAARRLDVLAKDSLQDYAWRLETQLDVAVRVTTERVTAERNASDSLYHAQQHQQVLSDSLIASTRPSRCGAKCGGVIAVGGIVVARIVWSALESLLGGAKR